MSAHFPWNMSFSLLRCCVRPYLDFPRTTCWKHKKHKKYVSTLDQGEETKCCARLVEGHSPYQSTCPSSWEADFRIFPMTIVWTGQIQLQEWIACEDGFNRMSGPKSPSLPVMFSEPGSDRQVLTKETWFSLLRERKFWKGHSEQFLPDQVFLGKNIQSRPNCTQKSSKEFWDWGWGSKCDP